jgi:hypothetical protein
MAYQIIKKAGTKWIKQPNRIVKTFPSGLCMIQQDYIADKNNVDYFAFREGDAISDKDSFPCIDGAYIFPAPDYQDMGNGFIKCTVTAYGRTTTIGQITEIFSATSPQRTIFTVNNANSLQATARETITSGLDGSTSELETVYTPNRFWTEILMLVPTVIQRVVVSRAEASAGISAPAFQVSLGAVSTNPVSFQNFTPFNEWINGVLNSVGKSTYILAMFGDFWGIPNTGPSSTSPGGRDWSDITRGRGPLSYNTSSNLALIRTDAENFGEFTEYVLTYNASSQINVNA